MATKHETITPATPASAPIKATPPVDHEPRNFLAAFLLTMVAGPLGLRHFYLGDNKLGWVRTGLFVGGYIVLFTVTGSAELAVLSILAFFAIMTAAIWALVDFFYVYNAVKFDAEGKPVTATVRDRKWAKIFYWAAIIGFVGSVVIGILGVAFFVNQAKNGVFEPSDSSQFENNGGEFNMEDYLRRLQEQSEPETQLN